MLSFFLKKCFFKPVCQNKTKLRRGDVCFYFDRPIIRWSARINEDKRAFPLRLWRTDSWTACCHCNPPLFVSFFLVDGRALMPIVNFCILIRKRKKVILCICMHSGRTFFLPYVWALYSSCIVAVWGLDWTPLARGQRDRQRGRTKEKKTNKWIIWCNYWYGILIFWVPLFS